MPSSIFSPLHGAARSWAENGVHVFPCAPDNHDNNKTPLTPNGVKDATTNIDQIDRWWAEFPNANIGIGLGASGLCAIDPDGEIGLKALKNLEKVNGMLPETFTVSTPRGGRHYYFLGSITNSEGKLATKVDTRGGNGYVIAPPSRMFGKPYEIIRSGQFAQLPVWIADRFTVTAEPTSTVAPEIQHDLPGNVVSARSYLSDLSRGRDNVIRDGERNSRTYQIAQRLREFGISRELSHELIKEILGANYEGMWPAEAMAFAINNAYEYKQNPDGMYAKPDFAETFSNLPVSETRDSAPLPRLFLRVSEQNQLRDPVWLVDKVIEDNSVNLFVGPKESLKSFVAMDLSLGIATGRPTFGMTPTRSGPVVYATYLGDGYLGIKQRRRAWQEHHGVLDSELEDKFLLASGPRLIHHEATNEWVKRLAGEVGKPVCVTFDTIFQLASGIDIIKEGSRLTEFAGALTDAFGCAVVFLHHPPKSVKTIEELTAAEGFGGANISANIPNVYGILREGRSVAVHALHIKDDDKPKWPWTFRYNAVGQSLALTQTTPREHRIIIKQKELTEGTNIYTALNSMRIISPKWISTEALADAIVPITASERDAMVDETIKRLRKLAKTDLRAYADGEGDGLQWAIHPLPTPI